MGEPGSDATRQPLTVAVSSPEAVVVAGLATLLSRHAGLRVVELHRDVADEEPDVVLYDVLGLLDRGGEDLAQLVQQVSSKVLAVSRDLRPDLVSRALEAGVDGFFSLGVDEDGLVAAVRSAGTGWEEGDPGADPTVGSSGSDARAARLGTDVGLTAREVQVLGLVARGLSNDEVGAHLFVTTNTVKTTIRSAYRKIGARTRPQAVTWAIQHGFAPQPTSEHDL